MSNKIELKVLLDSKIIEDFSLILDTIGLTITDITRLASLSLIQYQRLPNDLCIPNQETINALKELDNQG